MDKILLGINSLNTSQHAAYRAHMRFAYMLGRRHQNFDFILVNPSRMSIDRMRNICAKMAIEHDCKYILFLDDDVIPPMDGLSRLLNCDADIAAGNVIIRGYPFENMFFEEDKNDNDRWVPVKTYEKNKVIDVKAVGFSLALLKVDIIKQMEPPYFVTGTHHTEDIYFCAKALLNKPDLTVKVDTGCICGHILWDEIIDASNVTNYRKYYEEQWPDDVKLAKETKLITKPSETQTTYEEILAKETK